MLDSVETATGGAKRVVPFVERSEKAAVVIHRAAILAKKVEDGEKALAKMRSSYENLIRHLRLEPRNRFDVGAKYGNIKGTISNDNVEEEGTGGGRGDDPETMADSQASPTKRARRHNHYSSQKTSLLDAVQSSRESMTNVDCEKLTTKQQESTGVQL